MDWKLDSNGNIAVCPVGGWQTALVGGMALAIRLGFYRSEEALLRGEMDEEQFVLTPAQALELADVLRSGAEKAMTGPSSQTPQN
ncbi:hypothetical protein [Brevundimonas sp.]|uniref:hypothetical protein n=1 Tax=Brevundimonas sp. TaxID=1871086 RepID=UPI002CBB16D4|nr:hypothetical protein [Brevundimonas sp.]HWQ86013.1 hypothetical protein [Brevundimonas sp.]